MAGMIELGIENSCSDQIKFRAERENIETSRLPNGDYSLILEYFSKENPANDSGESGLFRKKRIFGNGCSDQKLQKFF